MASNYSKYILPLPTSLNDTDDDSLIIEDFKKMFAQCSLAENVDLKPDGFSPCKGYQKYNEVDFGANEVKSILEYQKDGVKSLIVTSNSKLKKDDGTEIGAVASDIVEGVNLDCAFYTNPTTESVAKGDKLLILDGTDYKYYDGTTLASVPAYTPTVEQETNPGKNVFITNPDEIKKAKFIGVWMNRVLVVKGRTLRWSDTQTMGGYVGNYFPATFEHTFELDCTGFVIDDRPFIFTDSNIHVLMGDTANSSGLNPYRVEDISTEVGCSSHRSIKATRHGIFFVHRKGIYRIIKTPEGYQVQKISKGEGCIGKIQKFIDSKTDQQIKDSYAVVGEDRYLLFFSDGTVAVFLFDTQGWTIYDNRLGNCGINFNDKVLTAKQYIYEHFKGQNYDGEAIEWKIRGRNTNLNLPTYIKEFDTWTISTRSDLISYTINLNYYMDGLLIADTKTITDRISKWGEFRFGDKIRTVDLTLNRPFSLSKGDDRSNFMWEISGSGLDEYCQVIGQFLEYKAKEMSS